MDTERLERSYINWNQEKVKSIANVSYKKKTMELFSPRKTILKYQLPYYQKKKKKKKKKRLPV